MLKKYLQEAISILDELIAVTTQDINNIKEAKHSTVEESVNKKNQLVKKFEATKSMLDKELVRVSKEHNSTDLASILDDDIKSNLVKMRTKLEELHEKNKEYAKYVVVVKEFFDSLVSNMFHNKNDSNGYFKSQPTPESLFKARV